MCKGGEGRDALSGFRQEKDFSSLLHSAASLSFPFHVLEALFTSYFSFPQKKPFFLMGPERKIVPKKEQEIFGDNVCIIVTLKMCHNITFL